MGECAPGIAFIEFLLPLLPAVLVLFVQFGSILQPFLLLLLQKHINVQQLGSLLDTAARLPDFRIELFDLLLQLQLLALLLALGFTGHRLIGGWFGSG